MHVHRAELRAALSEARYRSADERVAIAGTFGRAQTGMAFACLAVLDGAITTVVVDAGTGQTLDFGLGNTAGPLPAAATTVFSR